MQENKPKKNIHIKAVDPDVLAAVKKYASKEGLNLSSLTKILYKKYVDSYMINNYDKIRNAEMTKDLLNLRRERGLPLHGEESEQIAECDDLYMAAMECIEECVDKHKEGKP